MRSRIRHLKHKGRIVAETARVAPPALARIPLVCDRAGGEAAVGRDEGVVVIEADGVHEILPGRTLHPEGEGARVRKGHGLADVPGALNEGCLGTFRRIGRITNRSHRCGGVAHVHRAEGHRAALDIGINPLGRVPTGTAGVHADGTVDGEETSDRRGRRVGVERVAAAGLGADEVVSRVG